MAGKKKSKGRQGAEMKLIENETQRLITFSKRKAGINKKLSEMVTINDAEALFVVFSQAGNPFCFGSPSVESVCRRFIGGQNPNPENDPIEELFEEVRRRTETQNLTSDHNEVLDQLDILKEKGKALQQKLEENNIQMKEWWNCNVDDLNVIELREMQTEFKKLSQELCDMIKVKTEAFGDSFIMDNPSTSPANGSF